MLFRAFFYNQTQNVGSGRVCTFWFWCGSGISERSEVFERMHCIQILDVWQTHARTYSRTILGSCSIFGAFGRPPSAQVKSSNLIRDFHFFCFFKEEIRYNLVILTTSFVTDMHTYIVMGKTLFSPRFEHADSRLSGVHCNHYTTKNLTIY